MEAGGTTVIKMKSPNERYRLYALFDVHLGNAACEIERFRKVIEKIKKDKNGLWIGGGDYAEYIPTSDARFDPSVFSPAIFKAPKDIGDVGEVLSDAFCKEVEPIKNKCLGLLMGNHETRYMTLADRNSMHQKVCDRLGVRNLKYSVIFDLCFVYKKRKSPFRIYAHHGAGWAQTGGARVNRLERFMRDYPADITLIGHLHSSGSHSFETLSGGKDCAYLSQKLHHGFFCGTFLNAHKTGFTTYAEVRGLPPSTIGARKIELIPGEEHIQAAIVGGWEHGL